MSASPTPPTDASPASMGEDLHPRRRKVHVLRSRTKPRPQASPHIPPLSEAASYGDEAAGDSIPGAAADSDAIRDLQQHVRRLDIRLDIPEAVKRALAAGPKEGEGSDESTKAMRGGGVACRGSEDDSDVDSVTSPASPRTATQMPLPAPADMEHVNSGRAAVEGPRGPVPP
jgi:hypothetical protein